jgi:hypothetical protein
LQEIQQATLASPRHGAGWDGVARLYLADRQSLSLVPKALLSPNRAFLPTLPWAPPGPQTLGEEARAVAASSSRSFTCLVPGNAAITVKVHRPRSHAPAQPLREKIKRRVMETAFGVPAAYDGGAIHELDILHSLDNSSRVAAHLEHNGGSRYGVLREFAGITNDDGTGCILRETQPWPRIDGEAVCVPYYAFTEPPNTRRANLLQQMAGPVATRQAELAIQLSLGALGLWRHLLVECSSIAMLPHAQNLMREILPSNDLGRTLIKDFRDVDDVNRYMKMTSQSTYLSGIDMTYLNYEMTAHPFYYDTMPKIGGIAEKMFNYSWQMLRSYILQPLVMQVHCACPDSGRAIANAQTAIVAAMAEGAADDELTYTAKSAPFVSRQLNSQIGAVRALRRKFSATMEVA